MVNVNSNIIFGKQIEEQIGNTILTIYTGSLCKFNQHLRTNGVHTHRCFELCVVLDGCGYFTHDDETYFVEKGNVFIADPDKSHEVHIKQDQEMQLVFFFVEIISNTKSEVINIDEKCLNNFLLSHKNVSSEHANILAYFNFIDEYSDNQFIDSYGIYRAIRNLVIESLMSLSVKPESSPSITASTSTALIDKAIIYILNNLNKTITLEELSEHLHMSERNVQYLFKKKLNTSIKYFINTNRIGLSTTYLKANYNITQVCNIMGFSDISQFSKMYRKYCGISPKKAQNLSIDSTMNTSCVFDNKH